MRMTLSAYVRAHTVNTQQASNKYTHNVQGKATQKAERLLGER